MIRVFIGKDDVENVAYHTLCESIISQCSLPVHITPIYLKGFKSFFNRQRDPKQSNEFSYSRFLVPYLAGYVGHALFMDCDMLVRCDLAELWKEKTNFNAVQVVKHDYTPKDKVKYLGNTQYAYPKKNWSSVMLWNCAHFHCKRLKPRFVEKASGLELHQFKWTEEDKIGDLGSTWNHLVGEYPYDPDAKIVHFTNGGPYFDDYDGCDYSDEWWAMYNRMSHCDQYRERDAS